MEITTSPEHYGGTAALRGYLDEFCCLEGDCSKLSQVIGLMIAILHVDVIKTIMICDNLLHIKHYGIQRDTAGSPEAR